ncbi:MAG TPA: carbohydrate porin [Polyangiaceae bacterium]|nr:carbohydrate porin [Polyangiaceae bacterium]
MIRLSKIRRGPLRGLVACAVACILSIAAPARAGVTEPGERPDQQFDFMNLLSHLGLHDIDNESWNAYGQFTYITSYKAPFSAPYTNANGSTNSLLPNSERSWTGTFTLYLGAKLWPGAEVYFAPEVVAEQALSQLRGIGGAIQNFELQKSGLTTPILYRSRLYVQQTIGLGGTRVVKDSDPLQLGSSVDSRRLVFRLGNFSVIDFFDKNSFSGDLRQQFFNMAFMTYAAYDFVADARGYTWGGVAEFDDDDWAIRIGRLAPPQDPNSLPLTLQLDKFYGDQLEIEHNHRLFGQPGAVRLLGYRNRENMGRFRDAIGAFQSDPSKNAANCTSYNYGSQNAHAPDLCWARKPNVKMGIGLNIEQHVTDDIGVFFRGMVSDGNTEVYAFTSTDRSVSFGATAKGSLWHRPLDVTGIGLGMGWISQAHADYLRMGGIDGFIGDGNIQASMESVFDIFYSVSVASAVWLSADYQHLTHPAFNADRGPVDIAGARVHAEF